MVFSVTTAFFGLFAFGLSGIQEQRSQQQLYELLRGRLDPSSPLAPPVRGDVAPGTPVALIDAPAAGLRHVVAVQGTSSGLLLEGPGHLRTSPLPGQIGESILIGKGSTAGAPFGRISSLARGDQVTVTTGQGTFLFVVIDQRVAGDPLPRLPKSGALLTLVTSAGSGWLGRLAPSHLLYVDAALQGKAVGSPGGTPQLVPTSELAGNGDPSAWPFVVLWVQALVLSSVAIVWLWFRWGRWQTWLVGAPVLVGVLWGLSTEILRLLPNVY
jgi:sortase A